VTEEAARVHIGMLAVDGSQAIVAFQKMYLSGLEPERFRPGTTPAVLESTRSRDCGRADASV